ncbi:MAG: hypothetical protein Q4F66_09510, partial [Clostridium sp.]|nr:hypothetical protein [Clostridium sp.]
NSVQVTLSSQEAGTLVNIQDDSGKNIITFAPSKKFESIVISSPDLKTGETYKVNVGGSITSSPENGLYSDGTYSGGTEIKSFTISSATTSVVQDGVTVNSMGGGGRGMNGGGMGQKPMMNADGTIPDRTFKQNQQAQ